MYSGLEIDVLSLGDADCSIVTQWNAGYPHRILVDGGCGGHADQILDFLLKRGYTDLWGAVCTHKHNDHASGFIKLVESPRLNIHHGWMHDMRRHFAASTLARACSESEEVNSAFETTSELARAFANRNIPVHEPFEGALIAKWPDMVVLGPSKPFYESALREFTERNTLGFDQASWVQAAIGALGDSRPNEGLTYRLAGLGGSVPYTNLPALTGLLTNSSVKKAPATQPFNSTSVILGVRLGDCKMLLTADAGTEALACVSSAWNHLTYLGVPHHGSDGNLSQADIERFCPQFAFISAKGDGSHPSSSIVNGLIKAGAKVASTHRSGNLWFSSGLVPNRTDYGPVDYMKGNTQPDPRALMVKALAGVI